MQEMGRSKLESTLRYMALLEQADLQQKVEMIWVEAWAGDILAK